MASARDVVPDSEVLSMIRTRTPSLVSQMARTRPVGPAPMITTSVADDTAGSSATSMSAELPPLRLWAVGGPEGRWSNPGMSLRDLRHRLFDLNVPVLHLAAVTLESD